MATITNTIDREEAFDLDEAPASGSLWRTPGFPHSGWFCTDIEDLGAPAEICPVCGVREIRYVHLMRHAESLWEDIRAGCVCAGHISGSVAEAKAREDGFKKASAKKDRWIASPRWKQKGATLWRKEGDWVCMVFANANGTAGALVKHQWQPGRERRGKAPFPSVEAAKGSLFRLVQEL